MNGYIGRSGYISPSITINNLCISYLTINERMSQDRYLILPLEMSSTTNKHRLAQWLKYSCYHHCQRTKCCYCWSRHNIIASTLHKSSLWWSRAFQVSEPVFVTKIALTEVARGLRALGAKSYLHGHNHNQVCKGFVNDFLSYSEECRIK